MFLTSLRPSKAFLPLVDESKMSMLRDNPVRQVVYARRDISIRMRSVDNPPLGWQRRIHRTSSWAARPDSRRTAEREKRGASPGRSDSTRDSRMWRDCNTAGSGSKRLTTSGKYQAGPQRNAEYVSRKHRRRWSRVCAVGAHPIHSDEGGQVRDPCVLPSTRRIRFPGVDRLY